MTTNRDINNGKKTKEAPHFFNNISEVAKNETLRFVIGLVIAAFAVYLIIACISFLFSGGADQSLACQIADEVADAANSAGRSGAKLSETIINSWFGLSSFFLLAFLLITGCRLLMRTTRFKLGRWFISCAFLCTWGSVLFSLILAPLMQHSFINPGGALGMQAFTWLKGTIGYAGTILILLATLLLYCIWLTRRTIEWLRSLAGSTLKFVRHNGNHQDKESDSDKADAEYGSDDSSEDPEPATEPISKPSPIIKNPTTEENPDDDPDNTETVEPAVPPKPEPDGSDVELQINKPVENPDATTELEPYNPRLDLSHYKFPTIDLLKFYDDTTPATDRDEQEHNKNRIISVLRNFGIEIKSISATQGPTVTLYEITPADGVRISKIRGLEDDIALSLAALGIRIIAPIPGKGTIGIEVPNAKPVIVPMQSLIRSKKFVESKYELPVAIGKTITNEIFMFDLAKMPHLLVAGATGMGKSVGLNAIVTSLLYKKHPSELKLVMVDPKMVEFSIYESIEKHFLAKLPDGGDAIITDVTKVVKTLKSLCIEMDSRYELLKDANVRAVTEYNELFKARKLNPLKGHRFMPYIVVVIDEFGDLIMTAGKEIEIPIARIAQKARAVGIHMIIATQRPTTTIITGNIKANFPARIAFRVTTMIDSRTILDRPGANQLIGRGDMLFFQGGDPIRIQCAFVDTPEVQNVCRYISTQQSYTSAYALPEVPDENDGSDSGADLSRSELDPLFEEAARLIVIHQQGSTSLIQRKFSIGYNRAGRIMDQLEKAGIVGPADGSKPRQVLCSSDMDVDMKLQAML